MASPLPALNLVAAPGRRRATLDLAREIERRGFAGISISSQYSNMSQCLGLAFATERIPFATAIAPIYAARPPRNSPTMPRICTRYRAAVSSSASASHICQRFSAWE